MGHPAIAITDHGQTAGAFELWYACQGKPIKPLLGTEFYITTEMGTGHLVAIAMNDEGWRNILKLQHFAFTKGFNNRKPCITMKALEKYNKGIIITSACAANPIAHCIKRGEDSLAQHYAQLFLDIFGSRFYLEIQSSDIAEQKIINQGIVNISNKLGIELVLTNDCHYVYEEDAYPHEILLAVQTKQKISKVDRFKFDYQKHHFKTREEMIEPMDIDPKITERALNNTVELASRCEANIAIGDYRTAYDAPGSLSSEAYLRKLTTERYKSVILSEGKDTKKYREDVAHELDVICGERYADYYLVVHDYIKYARSMGQPVGDGRGSGVGSKVAYLTGITEVDPEPYNLPFERFLSVGREPDSVESFVLAIVRVKFCEPKLQWGVVKTANGGT
jgi:DNA polymerase-3 subunit alpha